MSEPTDIARRTTDFIVSTFLFGDAQAAPAANSSFLESGLIDSTGMLEVVTFIEQDFSIKILDNELIPENLDSIDRIVAFVHRKTSCK